jgi:hypothetical protein
MLDAKMHTSSSLLAALPKELGVVLDSELTSVRLLVHH